MKKMNSNFGYFLILLTLFSYFVEINSGNYKIENIGNSSISKELIKTSNLKCQSNISIVNFVNNIDEQKKLIRVIPVRGVLTKSGFAVYLSSFIDSLRDNIRMSQICKILKLDDQCIELIECDIPNGKKLGICFENDEEITSFVNSVEEFKKCLLSIENHNNSDILDLYSTLKFLQRKSIEANIQVSEPQITITKELEEVAYENNLNTILQAKDKADKTIDNLLDEMVDKSIQEKVKIDKKERQAQINLNNL